jgi:hypothetical protein
MDNRLEIMLNPEKFGYMECPHCNGYGSSLKLLRGSGHGNYVVIFGKGENMALFSALNRPFWG